MHIRLQKIIPYASLLIITALLIFSRFVGLDWGLPYPMHPDERNMAVAILQMSCRDITSTSCFHPNFFAYGQFPLYISYVLASFFKLIIPNSLILTFEHVTLALRTVSAVASVLMAFYILWIVEALNGTLSKLQRFSAMLLVTFVPAFIQFSHFGTTESLLMLFYTMMLYYSLQFLLDKYTLKQFVLKTGITLGIALGTKVSALIFVSIPALVLLIVLFQKREDLTFLRILFSGFQLAAIAFIFFVLTSPYNLIAWSDFLGSMDYESAVGLGTYRAFYTRQFEYTVPFVFQLSRILPYALGGPLMSLFFVSFLLLPYKKEYNVMRILFIIFLIPAGAIYAKWTRFLSPIFPLMIVMSILFFVRLIPEYTDNLMKYVSRSIGILVLLMTILPGIAYITIYTTPDVRFSASRWVYSYIEPQSEILSETANVIDVPIPNRLLKSEDYGNKSYRYISFNSYDVDIDNNLKSELARYSEQTPYIFVPSRRVFYNHTCYRPEGDTMQKVPSVIGYDSDYCQKLEKNYPVLNSYYDELFSGQSGFKKVAEFTSYPRIELFGQTLIEFPDEASEETWTVFDHPVIRIYARE